MKKKTRSKNDMLSEYNLNYSKARRNRFAENYHISVTLDSDVADVFQDSEAVNRTLRAIIAVIPKTGDKSRKQTQQKT